MNRNWLEITLQVPAAAVDLVCHLMTELGSEGITVEEQALDTFVPPDPDEMIADHYRLKIYFPAVDNPEGLRPVVRPVRQEDWAEGWKQHFGTVRIGRRLVVKPTWEPFSPEKGDVVVVLDPGMAFGTGTHGTTRLCLEALACRFDQAPPPERVLDVGTGSGILAIAAAALGAGRVVACDIDQTARDTARENSCLNRVEERLEIADRPLEELEGRFDVVLANILAEENIRLAPELTARLAEGGTLILSGILREKETSVIEAFGAYELAGPDISRQEEWSCLTYRKKL
jgi:ribosomal protein L11 methyltransferase